MLIWSGHGILIPLFAIFASLIGGTLTMALMSALGLQNATPAASTIVSSWFGVLGVYLYARTIGKTKREVLLDPKTGQEVVLAKRHTLFFIPAKGWVYLSGIIAAFVSVGAFSDAESATSSSGKPAALKEAETAISSRSNGINHGNTPQALEAATKFGKAQQTFREVAIGKTKQSAFSLSDGEFLTHCHATPRSIAFLVHVPSLRKFSKDAKDALAEVAGGLAVGAVQAMTPPPTRIAVGIRGAVLYDRIIVIETGEGQATQTYPGTDDERLYPFYTQIDEPQAQPNSVKADQPKEASTTSSQQPDATSSAATPSAPPTEKPDPSPKTPKASLLPIPERDWTSSDGRPLRASLQRFLPGEPLTGEFKRSDGSLFTVPVERFSTADKQTLRELAGASP
jgi:hypothetical protein